MTRGVLVVGNESALFNATAIETSKRVESYASAIIQNRFITAASGTSVESAERSVHLSWNPASAISARTLVLAAENRLKKINDAILICSPPALYKTAEALTPKEIEILVDDHIKGWFFLIRELILYFRNTGSGLLALVTPEISAAGEFKSRFSSAPRTNQTDLLGPSAAASFRSYSQTIIASSVNEPYQVMGFTTSETGSEEEFAAWFFKIIDEAAPKNSARWHKYSKRGFFGR